MLVLTLGWLQL